MKDTAAIETKRTSFLFSSLCRALENTRVSLGARSFFFFFPRSLRELRTNTCGFPAGCPRSIDCISPTSQYSSYSHIYSRTLGIHTASSVLQSSARLYTRVRKGTYPLFALFTHDCFWFSCLPELVVRTVLI